MKNSTDGNLSLVLIQLLKGVVYQEQHKEIWRDLLMLQAAARDYFTVLGLHVVIDEAEGYAFLRQAASSADEKSGLPALPRLIPARPLSYPLSLLCVLLRKKLAEKDASGGETRLVLGRDHITEMMRVYMPDQKNEARTADVIYTNIKKAVDLGFLRKLTGDDFQYEVRRIIKSFVDADWLSNLDERLKEYQEYAAQNS